MAKGDQLEAPGIPAKDLEGQMKGLERELSIAVAEVLDLEKALRAAKVRERAARAAMGRFLRS